MAFAAPALAQDPAAKPPASQPQATQPQAGAPAKPELLTRLEAILQKPFECDVNLSAQAEDETSGSGHVAWGGAGKLAVNLTLKGVMEGEDLTMKLVADGKDLYAEFPTPQGTQVMKLSLALLKNKDAVGQLAQGMDFSAVLEGVNKIQFKEEVKDGVRNLTATVSESDLGGDGDEKVNVALALDEKTWFPRSLKMVGGGEEEVNVELITSGVQFPESIPAERFQYTAPQGVPVIDLSMFLGVGGGEGEEEF
ncbi:MAG: hypothetical protein EYC70_08400 [Planctomycetota bacterium]|nr:MAG: hypothetical protein EYC70_08400 [Planctomycetota bacterium]